VLNVEEHGGGYMFFKRSLALKEPAGDFDEIKGAMAGQGEDGIDQSIRFYEGTVQIDAEGRLA
jgi:hypothetical protein